MKTKYRFRSFVDLIHGVTMNFFFFNKHERASRERIIAYQKKRLTKLVQYAINHSPFYRKLYSNIDLNNFKITDLPPTNKKMIMGNYDDVVTVKDLKIKELKEHLANLKEDTYYKGKYKVFSSSGSSGNPIVVAYNRVNWSLIMAMVIRLPRHGIKFRLGKRIKGAALYAHTPTHDSIRMVQTFDMGFARLRYIPSDTPFYEVLDQLNEWEPEVLSGYPTIIEILAHAQLDGYLKIKPGMIHVGGEPFTKKCKKLIKQAWGIEPLDVYGSTEAITVSWSCHTGSGMHINEDIVILEVVDDENRPVPDGQKGSKILLTNLFSYAQPIIRFAISDIVKVKPELCNCGCNFKLMENVEGRTEDTITLPRNDGSNLCIKPSEVNEIMGNYSNVKQFQLIQEPNNLQLNLVLSNGMNVIAAEKIGQQLKEILESKGAILPPLETKSFVSIPRVHAAAQKLKQILVRN